MKDHEAALAMFPGDSEMARVCRAFDWASTPLGAVAGWPPSLRTTAGVVLGAGFPMVLLWGPELIQLYNDAYVPFLAGKHPGGLGRPTREVWPEVWHINEPIYARVRAGETVALEEAHFPVRRQGNDGRIEDLFITLAYSPVPDDVGAVGGVLITLRDVTAEVAGRAAEAERARLAAKLAAERMGLLEEVFRQSPSFLHVLRGPDFVFELANESYYQLVGRRDILGRPAFDVLSEARGGGFEERIATVMATGEPFVGRELPVMLARTPGARAEERLIDLVYLPLADADGRYTRVLGHGIDVTAHVHARRRADGERARAEAALRESEARSGARAAELHAVLESMSDAVYIGGTEGITLANASALQQLGYATRDELNRHIGTLAAEIDTRDAETGELIPVERQAFSLALAGERVVQDVRVRHRLTGETRVVRCAASPIVVEERVIAAVAVNTDVTDRRRVEATLRASEARQAFLVRLGDALRPLADPVAVQVAATRLLGEHLGANQVHYGEVSGDAVVIRQGYGMGLPPMAGTFHHARDGWGARLLESYRAGRTAVCHDIDRDPTITPAEAAVITGAGFRAYIAVPLVKEGVYVAVLAVHAISPRDWRADEVALVEETAERTWAAVERARAEAALRDSEARYRTLVENLRDHAIFRLDADGVVSDWTAGAERVTGYAGREVIGRHASLFYTPEAVAAGEPARELAEAAASGRAERESWRVRKGGERFWSNEIATAIRDGEGRLVGFTKVSRDLTERRLLAAAAEQAQLAGARDDLRRHLVAAEEAERRRLARELHDQLGQELTAFRLGLDDAARLAATHDGARSVSDAPLLQRIAHLQALARRMTAGARYLALELRPPELDDLGLESALATFVAEWSSRYGVAAEVAVTGDVEREIAAEVGSALYRIVQEALTNVAKHAEATEVSVILEKPDGELRLIVEDDGRGFDPEPTRTRVLHERRLGLAGMRERAALIGGTVAVESSPGGGTTLYVRVPVSGISAHAAHMDASHAVQGTA